MCNDCIEIMANTSISLLHGMTYKILHEYICVKRNYQGLQTLYSISYAIVLLETCFCVDVFGYNSSFTSLIPHRISFCRNDMLGDFAFLHQSTHVG